MKSIAGSILVLAAAILLQPVIENFSRMGEAMLFAVPVLIFAVAYLIAGLRSES
ncbi:hypothetical protein [Sulfuriroseicoccus oceanibius]|uniref:Uncharacterized protein n=1 Tax=Sulfuriroseicoccus oceanibius TaxID=2707525 RepID=A0A6B3L6I8_9BACT|nr:hypothetical protein [Sulfuriroseicoccus oceanibius]QQL44601.1 hypothetical protein G3M56_012020 [Sulfuriroseicoccus oceanibius]